MINRQVVLRSYVKGVPEIDNFGMVDGQRPVPKAGEFVVRNLYFSLEAAIRGWLDGSPNYFEPIPIGGVIRGPTVGRVVESRNPNFKEGDIVWGLNHWEEFSLLDDNTILLRRLETRPGVPLSYYIGALGGSGQTGYVGMHTIGRIKPGETVVVSAAVGATGSIAAQVAKVHGCRVIGIVGSADKVRVAKSLGMDDVVDYRATPDVDAAIKALCPDGVDVYFDNVGGTTLDAMLLNMKDRGRIVCCGMISDYNNQEKPTPIYHIWQMVVKQIEMRGFLLHLTPETIPEAMDNLHKWIAEGRVKVLENLTRGIENSGKAYSEMLKGKTIGKNAVELVE